MFGAMRKAFAVAAVAAVSALAPAVASADVWSVDGVNPWSGPAHVSGQLTLTLVANQMEITCDATGTLDLDNGGSPPWGAARGQVTSFTVSNCTTTVPGCAVTMVANGLPWNIDTQGTTVTFTGMSFTIVFSGSSCALNGASIVVSGDASGDASSWHSIEFVGATGLSSPFGPWTLDGQGDITAEDTGQPVTLIP